MASNSERLARVARRHTLSLTHHGRRTGKPYTVTIWFVVDGDIVWIESADVRRQWTRNVRARPEVEIAIGDERFVGTVTPVDDPATLVRAVDLLAAKYWFVKPFIWLDRWMGRSGLGPYGGAFRLELR
jgi:deazaflavin-dependent oxidoreductase (nitroreductase family)